MSEHSQILSAATRPLQGPCEAEAVRWRSHLTHLSGPNMGVLKPVAGLEAQARRCRRAGHRYFLSTEFDEGSVVVGTCLPASCAQQHTKELHAAAEHVLGIGIQRVVAYTAFTVAGSARRQPSSRDALTAKHGASMAMESMKTEWHEFDYVKLAHGESALPPKFARVSTLALTMQEFRGAVQDYLRAIWAIISHLGAQLLGAVLFLVAGNIDATIPLSDSVSVRFFPGLPFCGQVNLMERLPEAALGIVIALPPMWPLLVAQRFLDMNVKIDLGTPSLLVCDLDLSTHLHWTVPNDAMLVALELAERGPCASAVARMLPELAADFTYAASNASIDWPMVEKRTVHCIQHLEAAMWQLQVDASSWPALLSEGKPLRERFGGPAGSLTAFMCVPSRFVIEMETHVLWGIPPEAGCIDKHVGTEVLPLLLAFQSGLFEALSATEPPRLIQARYGGRAPSAIHPQLINYHAAAVGQRSKARRDSSAAEGASSTSTAFPSPSAAVCVAGRARSFTDPEVYLSIVENVTGSDLGAEASFFYVLDIGDRSLTEYAEAFQHLPPTALALVRDDNWGEPVSCEAFQLCGPACLYQFQKLRNCLHLVQAAEASRGRPFDWLIRIRPDTVWRAPIGDLVDFEESSVHLVMGVNKGDPEDNFALVPRQHGEAYFDIGAGCPTAEQTQNSGCAIPWYEGAHITPECALRTRMAKFRVPIVSFPKIYQIKREEVCRQDDPRGCGQCSRGVCRYDYGQ